jgi:hypothetical protein
LLGECVHRAFTARLVKSAIDDGYCAYDYLQVDPMLKDFRKSPEYPAVLAEGKQCQDRFLAERNRPLSYRSPSEWRRVLALRETVYRLARNGLQGDVG